MDTAYSKFVANLCDHPSLVDRAALYYKEIQLLHAAIGLCGEAGELLDIVKKFVFQGHDLDKQKAIGELGDIGFYFMLACNSLGVTPAEVVQANIEKLNSRYSGGVFTTTQSLNRKDQ